MSWLPLIFLAAILVGCAGNPWLTAAFIVTLGWWALNALGVLPRLEWVRS